ncbi:hypothetical protein E2986_09400 [Frieseomelitta varia]|uniref:Phospholipid/glycerol acyltransferase domain-containing protein n=1 Tax=Frieseomelitta varia TaxID=561572 RepID=A0A833W997_9HYME|nr:hypothetical protein E2986_09400 [Frieseomelitta varia]
MGLLSLLKQSNVIYIIFGITFLTSGLIINFFQCFLYFGLRPFSRYLYRKINYYLCYSLYSQFVFVAEWWAGLELRNLKKIINMYEIDWICGWILCERTGVLGNCKAYVKKSLQYVPTFGWAWRFAEFIFMERNWEKDKKIITSLINELVNYPDSITLLLCAEGTRVTAQKLEASQKFAQKAGLPILNYHLTPRTKGFIASLPHMRGKITDIYDIQLQFKSDDPIKPTLTNLLQGKQVTAYLSISRIPLDEVPEDEKGAEEWLHKLYEKKDRMAKSFEETGDFFAISEVPKLERSIIKKRYYSLVNIICWTVVVLTPMLYYLINLLLSGSIIYFLIGASIYLLMQRMIGMSKISKSSSYGTNDKKLQ